MNKAIEQLQADVEYWEDQVFTKEMGDDFCYTNGSIYPLRKQLDKARNTLNLAQQNMAAAMSALNGEELENEQCN